MGKHIKSILLVLIAIIAVFLIVERVVLPQSSSTRLTYSDFYHRVQQNQVKDFHATNHDGMGKLKDGTNYSVTVPDTGYQFSQFLEQHGVNADYEQANNGALLGNLISFVPLILMGVLLFFILRQAQNGGSQALSFGRSRAKMLSENRPKVTFADVAGVDEAKEELAEIVDFLKYPKKYQSLGARIPKGVLLLGPPGTGKTLLARAIAGEARVPFLSISGSDFVEMFVGVGASRVQAASYRFPAAPAATRLWECARPATGISLDTSGSRRSRPALPSLRLRPRRRRTSPWGGSRRAFSRAIARRRAPGFRRFGLAAGERTATTPLLPAARAKSRSRTSLSWSAGRN